MRVLVIEDNEKMASVLSRGLEQEGFAVDVCHTGYDGIEKAMVGQYAAIVLDVMLPDHNGIAACRDLRRLEVDTPILLLTALSETKDKVDGLNAGADDYLAKPFEFEELVARLRALMRRAGGGETTVLRYHDLEMDLLSREVRRAGEPISLTAKEFSLLEFFLRRSEEVLSRVVIGEQVWDMNFDPGSNVIDVYVSMLRRKVDKPFDTPLIQTVIGSGYKLSVEEDG